MPMHLPVAPFRVSPAIEGRPDEDAPTRRSPAQPKEMQASSDNRAVNGPVFRFRLERVRAVRERKEQLAQQELAQAISSRTSTAGRAACCRSPSGAGARRTASPSRRGPDAQCRRTGRAPGVPRAHRGAARSPRPRARAARGGGRRARRQAHRSPPASTRCSSASASATAASTSARPPRPRTGRARRDRSRALRPERA